MVKEIKLTRGYIAFVDDEDYERLSFRNYFASVGTQVRAARMQYRQMIYLHHDVLGIHPSELNGLEVDHKDRNPLNNTKENLRIVTHEENMANSRMALERVGYCFNKRAKLWSCYLDRSGYKRKYLGYAKTEEEAKARVEAARAHLED